jgi:hypothetical protein
MTNSRTADRLARGTRAGTLALLGILAFGLDAAAATREEVMKMVSDEATRNGRVPVSLALAVARVESNFNDRAVSSAGARGVMQIMPSTAMGEFGVPREQLLDPKLNVRLGVAYLERLYNQYGQDWELALSHYNGGSLRSRTGRFVAHDYTRQYVADVIRYSRSYQSDGTAVTLASGGETAGDTQVAWQRYERYPTGGRYPTRRSEVDRQEAAAVDGDRFFSDMLAQSTRELGERFRARLISRGDIRPEYYTEHPARPVEPVRREDWPEDAVSAPQRPPIQSGRFNYAPYGRGRFL